MSRRRRAILGERAANHEADSEPLLEPTRESLDESRRLRESVIERLSTMHQKDKYLKRTRIRNVLMLVNVMVVYTLYVVVNQMLDEAHWHVRNTLILVINVLSLVHLLAVVESHIFRGRPRLKRLANSHLVPRRLKVRVAPLNAASDRTNVGLIMTIRDAFAAWRSSDSRYVVFLECLLVLPQPIPFLADDWATEIGLVMALRLYWLAVVRILRVSFDLDSCCISFQVYRDFSSIYRARQQLAKEFSHVLRPVFGTTLALRSFFCKSTFRLGFFIFLLGPLVWPVAVNLFMHHRNSRDDDMYPHSFLFPQIIARCCFFFS